MFNTSRYIMLLLLLTIFVSYSHFGRLCGLFANAHDCLPQQQHTIPVDCLPLTQFISVLFITEALRLHGSRLSDYERIEIDKYQEIWFLGLDACKINAKPGTALNSGYDDDNGSYNKVRI